MPQETSEPFPSLTALRSRSFYFSSSFKRFLIALQATKLLAPPAMRELRYANRTNRFANRSALRK
jgi:hypothetical protein